MIGKLNLPVKKGLNRPLPLARIDIAVLVPRRFLVPDKQGQTSRESRKVCLRKIKHVQPSPESKRLRLPISYSLRPGQCICQSVSPYFGLPICRKHANHQAYIHHGNESILFERCNPTSNILFTAHSNIPVCFRMTSQPLKFIIVRRNQQIFSAP